RHPGAEPEFYALLGEHALELFCNLAVHTAEDSVEIFHDRDLGAEARPDRAELKADDAAADHDHAVGHLGKFQSAGRGNDHLLIELHVNAGDAGDIRAGGDDDVRRHDILRQTVSACATDLAVDEKLADAAEQFNHVLLHQKVETLGVLLAGNVLVLQHLLQVDIRRADIYPKVG